MKKNFIYNFLLTGSNLLFPLLTFPYLSRILGADGLGVVNFILSYCGNFIIISALGLPVYGIREIAKMGSDKIKRSELFFELLIFRVAFTLLLLVVYFITVFSYKDFHNYHLLALTGGLFILSDAVTCEWLFTGVSDFKYITLRSVLIKAIAVVVIFVLVREKADFSTYFFIYIAQAIITVIINLFYAHKYISRKITITYKKVICHVKPLFVLGVYIVITSIYTVLPNTLLGFLAKKEDVGYFYSADKIIRIVISFFGALSIVMIPKMNMLFEEKNDNDYKNLIGKSLNFVISFGIPASFFVFLLAKPLVVFLAGSGFENSIICIQIMAPVILLVAFSQTFCMQILNVNRKDSYLVLLATLGMILSLVINLLFIRKYASVATAYSQLIAEFFVTVTGFYLANRVFKFNFPAKSLIYNIICIAPFALITYAISLFTDSNFIKILFSVIICGGYFLVYQLFILKDKLLLELIEPYVVKIRKVFKNKIPE